MPRRRKPQKFREIPFGGVSPHKARKMLEEKGRWTEKQRGALGARASGSKPKKRKRY